MSEPEPYEIDVPEAVLDDLRERLRRTRRPEQPAGTGWAHGGDYAYLRSLCDHWEGTYDWRQIERALNGLSNWRWEGIHLIWERAQPDRRGVAAPERLPILLIHGWPGAPIEFLDLAAALVAAGHDVVIPSLPGFAFSEPPPQALGVAGVATRLRELMGALGYRRYAVQGGDWGAIIGARIAFDDPEAVAALHVNAPGVLPVPGNLADPPMSEAELAYAERRFSKDELCDFLTLYWATATIASSMRLYAAEARDRWRLAAGERIEVPAAVADFPAELVRPPRAWTERVLGDLRRWTEFDRGGHFAAFEEPELLGDDLRAFLAEL